jgi:hypothetical protein
MPSPPLLILELTGFSAPPNSRQTNLYDYIEVITTTALLCK